MSILLELNRIVDGLGILVETGVFKDKALMSMLLSHLFRIPLMFTQTMPTV